MFPVINSKATGVNLRRIMDSKNISVKDLQQLLGLSSQQSIYHWLNGICLPSVDNLYAMSVFFQLPIDDIIQGNCCTIRTRLILFWEFISFGHQFYIRTKASDCDTDGSRPDYSSIYFCKATQLKT